MNIPVGIGACDSGHQQLLPVKALGSEYLGVRYRDRSQGANETLPGRLVGAVDGTSLTYDPAPAAGAPLLINSGQALTFNASDAFSVTSQDAQHPFYMAGHMTGALSDRQRPQRRRRSRVRQRHPARAIPPDRTSSSPIRPTATPTSSSPGARPKTAPSRTSTSTASASSAAGNPSDLRVNSSTHASISSPTAAPTATATTASTPPRATPPSASPSGAGTPPSATLTLPA